MITEQQKSVILKKDAMEHSNQICRNESNFVIK